MNLWNKDGTKMLRCIKCNSPVFDEVESGICCQNCGTMVLNKDKVLP